MAKKGVSTRAIAEAIGRSLKVPVVSLTPEEAGDHFGWLGAFLQFDLSAFGTGTEEQLAWRPTGSGLIDDRDYMQSFES